MRRIMFLNETQKFGEPIAASPNGRVLVLHKNLDSLYDFQRYIKNVYEIKKKEKVELESSARKETLKRATNYSIMRVNAFGVNVIKTVNILESLRGYFE